jgi:hypothetical protein
MRIVQNAARLVMKGPVVSSEIVLPCRWLGSKNGGTPIDNRGLLGVPDQCIAQTILERAEPGLVGSPLEEPLSKNRLADLL